MKHGQLVRIRRRFEEFDVRGYAYAIGPKFFLLALVSDRLWFDGFECFRIKDTLNIEADKYTEFVEAALRKRGEEKPQAPVVDMESIERIMLTASEAFPLLTLHMEKKAPDVCYIGNIQNVENKKVNMLCIRPDAEWEKTPNVFPLNKITRVNFGGDYEEALHLVGGDARL